MNSDRSAIAVVQCSERRIKAGELLELYASEPWWPERSLEDVGYVLENHAAVGAWEGEKLIGFARTVSDGRFRAYIEDVLVLEEYRRQGVGAELLRVVLDALQDIHVVTLFCQPKLSAYYTDLGFKEFSKQVVMHRRNMR